MKSLKESLISNIKSRDSGRTGIKNIIDKKEVTKYIRFILNLDLSKEDFANSCITLDSTTGKVTFDANVIRSKFAGIYLDFDGLLKNETLNINHIHFKNAIYTSAGDNRAIYNWFNVSDTIHIDRPITISSDEMITITGIRNLNCIQKLNLINTNLVGTNLSIPAKLTGSTDKFISQFGLVLCDNMIYNDKVDDKIFREYHMRFNLDNGQMSYEPMMSNEFCFKELVKEIEKYNKFLIDGNIIFNNMYSNQGRRTELKFTDTQAIGISRTEDSGIREFISKYGKYFNNYKVYKFSDIKTDKTKKHKYDKYHCIIFKGPKIVKSI